MDGCAGTGASAELAAWLREQVAAAGLSHRALAARIYQHRSGVSKALSGSAPLPAWSTTRAIADACGANLVTAARLWDAARSAAAARVRRAADGWPPDGLADHEDLCRALHALVTAHGLSLRELVERDESAVLTRSMAGYVLRGRRRLTYRVMIAVITVCGVSPDAEAKWQAAWRRLAAPEIAARERARLEGLRASQDGVLIWMGRSW